MLLDGVGLKVHLCVLLCVFVKIQSFRVRRNKSDFLDIQSGKNDLNPRLYPRTGSPPFSLSLKLHEVRSCVEIQTEGDRQLFYGSSISE